MNKLVLLLLLLLLGGFPFMFFQGVGYSNRFLASCGYKQVLLLYPAQWHQDPATLCMVCNHFKKGHCLRSKGNCTMKQGPGCRTRDFFIFNGKGWKHNHTELDCSDHCLQTNFYFGDMKISTFCCKGREFCNKHQGIESTNSLL